MAQFKIKSPKYLEFLHTKRCIVCGGHATDAHHEPLSLRFKGTRKKYLDFQAIPLCHQHHLYGIHDRPDTFWSEHNIDVRAMALALVEEYYEMLDERMFSAIVEYEKELELVQQAYALIKDD